jgi:hypothetical protein
MPHNSDGNAKKRDEHSKDPRWKTPIDLPSVSPEDYAGIDSGRGSFRKAPDALPDQNGIRGFASILGGHAKADYSNTTSFDGGGPQIPATSVGSGGGQEEGARPRQETTSVVGRILRKGK